MGILDSLARQVLKQATVARTTRIAAHTYHLTLTGPDLAELAYTPGQTLNLFFDLTGPEAALRKRTYSIWHYDAVACTLELAVCTFSGGPGARWAQHCRAGDVVHFHGPGGKFVLDPTAGAYCLVGDVSSLAHLYELRRHLPPGSPVYSLVHTRDPDDCFSDLDGTRPLRFVTGPLPSAGEMVADLGAQGANQGAECLFYVGGPKGLCVEMHRLLRQRWGVPTQRIKAKPFWG